MRKGIAAVLLATCSGLAALASDLTITSKVSGKGPGGKLDGNQIQYFSATKMRVDDAGGKLQTLVDYDTQVMYSIQHDKKKIAKFAFQDLADAMKAMEAQMAGMPEMVTKMMVGDVGNVKVEKLGKDTVAGRSCDKVRITVGKLVQEMSLDPTLEPPLEYAKAMQMVQRIPGPIGVPFQKMFAEFAKLKGFPLRTHMVGLAGMDQTTEATEISRAALPTGTWALPDYPVEDQGKKMKESLQKH